MAQEANQFMEEPSQTRTLTVSFVTLTLPFEIETEIAEESISSKLPGDGSQCHIQHWHDVKFFQAEKIRTSLALQFQGATHTLK